MFQILYQLMLNVEQHEQASQSFYLTYFTDILQHVFSVVTDTSHTAGEIFCLLCEQIMGCDSLESVDIRGSAVKVA